MLFSITLLQVSQIAQHQWFYLLEQGIMTILQLTTRIHILCDCITFPKIILEKTCIMHFDTSPSLVNGTFPFFTWEQPFNKLQWQLFSRQVCYAIWCMQWAHHYNCFSTSMTQSHQPHLNRLLLRHEHKQWATQNFNRSEGTKPYFERKLL